VAGGEPLYAKKVWDFIETIPNPENVTIQFQTNFSILEYKGVSIFEFTKKFKSVVYSISLDGLFETGEFQRTNFKTNVFLDNLKKLNEEVANNPNIRYDFTFTTSILNVFNFFETYDYLINNGFIKDYSNLRFQIVKWPAHLDVKNFNVVKEVKEYYSRTDIKGKYKNPFLKGDIENFITYIEKDGWVENKEHLENLKNYLIFSKDYNNLKLPNNLEKYI
jgi:hypothetical protein